MGMDKGLAKVVGGIALALSAGLILKGLYEININPDQIESYTYMVGGLASGVSGVKYLKYSGRN